MAINDINTGDMSSLYGTRLCCLRKEIKIVIRTTYFKVTQEKNTASALMFSFWPRNQNPLLNPKEPNFVKRRISV